MNKKILITGMAGFIGHAFTKRLLEEFPGITVTGLDNINEYYDVRLKYGRLADLGIVAGNEIPSPFNAASCGKSAAIKFNEQIRSKKHPRLSFVRLDLAEREQMNVLFGEHDFDMVIHLAAQAGVRYSIDHPQVYIESNLTGFANILEGCRKNKVQHLVYASSSSVYGNNIKIPYSTADRVDHPVSLYAATKKSNELMAHAYAHLYDLPVTGLRFFTVYGPWGRPDMAYFKFVRKIMAGESIDVYNHGNLARDFTYIDDITAGMIRVIQSPPQRAGDMKDASRSMIAPYKVYNIGRNKPVKLLDFIESIEKTLKQKAGKNMLPMQPGDVNQTWADTSDLEKDFNYKPSVSVEQGMHQFVKWYRKFYQQNG